MKAMILAAGRGERMRPLTDVLPKPLLPVAGKPLIRYHLEALSAAGVKDIVINHAWLGHLLPLHLGSGQDLGLHLQYSDEGAEGLETAGGIKRALPLLGDAPFIVVNGDVFTDYPYQQLADKLSADSLAHLVLVPNPLQHPKGDFGINVSGKAQAVANECFTFSGIAIYRPEFFSAVAEGKQKLAPYLRQAMQQNQITAELYQGIWHDIGTVQRLEQLSAQLESANVG
ncbi:N-acetylmuramate alpha-1-phosphate uridylyltransferase MurU [Rheinheimera sp.]|jgi:MurNAc alpha-1-phosphate uridylyltransferase|uniref:N-acetylmuramate alpha-1-phosphate uridylyltransferase MurU n=1 Tax=Rheinheimera sp. TaxID=1869214 RepID=UPI00261596E3|nr:nucleotidyltransferase family protein [Rheinheimera sp.]MCA1929172.1 nucleotidyltransferase family protein [Rheinheimera sp.]